MSRYDTGSKTFKGAYEGIMKESSVERKLVEGCRKAGALAWKFTSPGRSGVPDRVVLLPGGQLIFVELKTETGRLTALQKQTHNLLKGYGFDVRTLKGAKDVEVFLFEVSHRCKGVRPSAIQTLGLSEDG